MMVKVNSSMLMIGSIGYDLSRDKPFIHEVLWMGKDVGDLEQLLNKTMSVHIVVIILSGCAFAGIAKYIFDELKVLLFAKKNLLRQQRMKERFDRAAAREIGSELTEDQKESFLCMVCNEYYREVICLPCHHLLSCKACYDRLGNKANCMMCKKAVTGVAYVLPPDN